MIVIVAEKPSVARDLAAERGATVRKNGYLEGNGYQVTWAVGHLVRLAEPDEIRPEWGRPWRAHVLPMLPEHFPLEVVDRAKDQFRVVQKLLRAPATREVICATDAGREGELIFRMIYGKVGCTKPVKRLWVSSLTPAAIRDGFRSMKPLSAYDALAQAATARQHADWLVGMNLSRAYWLGRGRPTSVGRVQTPTLALVVARDRKIASFVPTHFRKVVATFVAGELGSFEATYVRQVDDPKTGAPKDSPFLPMPGPGLRPEEDADVLHARCATGKARIRAVERMSRSVPPPQLFDLTTLQRTANRLWGWTAEETLRTAQALYEEHKLLSYPRTDSRYLSAEIAATLPRIVEAISAPYRELLSEGTGSRALGKRFVDDGKVSDHHAIIPTGTDPRRLVAGSREALLFDLVCRQLLGAWQSDLQLEATEVVVQVTSADAVDRYVAKGTAVKVSGWKALELKDPESAAEVTLPSRLVGGVGLVVREPRIREDKTRPEAHYTEGELLRAMETAGRGLSDEQAEAMKDKGLGTPATRAAIIEVLVKRGYLARRGKSLRATVDGMELVDAVHPQLCSVALTGEMEAELRAVERGKANAAEVVVRVERFVTALVRDALKNGVRRLEGERRELRFPARGGRRRSDQTNAAGVRRVREVRR